MKQSRVVYVFALPKSGSRLLYRTILDAQPEDGAIPLHHPAMARDAAHAVNMETHYHYLAQLEEGLLHSHASPLPYNFVVLRDLGIRHVVTMRHPADHVTALYCHLRNLVGCITMPPAKTTRINTPTGTPAWHAVIFPINQSYIDNGVSIEDSLNHLIRDGYLTSALKWMSDWLLFANELSLILRYEDMIANPTSEFMRTYRHLFRRIPHSLSSALPVPPAHNPVAYPNGYSGKPAIWKDYFTPSNIDAYNRTVTSFLAAYAPAQKLSALYSDILVPDCRI